MNFLKFAEGKSFQDQNRGDLNVDCAKNVSQLQRDGFSCKAMDELKKTNDSQIVNIVWQKIAKINPVISRVTISQRFARNLPM